MTRILYGFPISSCTHRVRLFLRMLSLEFEERVVNLATGEHRESEFLALNPAGQVPVLADNGKMLFDSHAILIYLAEAYGRAQWWPENLHDRALVMQWMFFDCNEIHNGIGMARNHLAFSVPGDAKAAVARADAALGTLQRHLDGRSWLALGRPTLADLACAPLVDVAGEAGLSLQTYPAVAHWFAQIEKLAGYVPMPRFKR